MRTPTTRTNGSQRAAHRADGDYRQGHPRDHEHEKLTGPRAPKESVVARAAVAQLANRVAELFVDI
jgi:hypothetical protein